MSTVSLKFWIWEWNNENQKRRPPWKLVKRIHPLHPEATIRLCNNINYTHQQMHFFKIFMKSKIHIKTFKTLLHVLIFRSSSESIHGSFLKLYIKTISELLHYINTVMWQHVVCLYVFESFSLHKVQRTYKHTTCCHITRLI
jgi:hypothetical protein